MGRSAGEHGRVGPAGSGVRYAGIVVLLAAAYFGAAKLGLSFAFATQQVTAVWPPTGIAVAALFLLGARVWPGVLLGAFAANATHGEPLATAAGIAAGNTLGPLAGALLLRRAVRLDPALARIRDVLGLLLVAIAAMTITATNGVAQLALGGLVPPPSYGSVWWVWWVGDAMGVLLVAPLLLSWAAEPRIAWRGRRALEAGALFASLAAACHLIFLESRALEIEYAVFPFIIWSALRFGVRETAAAVVLIAGIASWGTIHDRGPFATGTLDERLAMLEVFLAVAAVAALSLAAVTSERRRAEDALETTLDELEERVRERTAELAAANALFGLIARHAQDIITTDDARGVLTSVSPACRRILGYAPEELIGMRGVDLVHPEDRAATVIARMGSTRESQLSSVVRCRRKDGAYVWVESNAYVVRDPDTGAPLELVSIARDISERKAAEDTAGALEASLRASEARTAAMLDAIPDLMFRMTADGTFLDYRAPSANELYVAPEKIVGGNVRELMPPAFAEACLHHIGEALATGARRCWEFQLPMPQGPQDFEARMVPIGPGDVLAIVRDISASKAEGVIRNALREKEVLLKEVHHRVKNNLQVISSLLALQAMHVADAASRELFARARSRVHSIALVHEKLYQSRSLSRVDFHDYARVLVESLCHAHAAAERGIAPAIDVGERDLAVDIAIPCGLVINELVTNALKHGFPDGRAGSIRVALSRGGPDRLELRVADDGVGLPAGLDPRRSGFLGLDLVFTFAEQLDAEVDVARDRGTAFCLRFSCGGS